MSVRVKLYAVVWSVCYRVNFFVWAGVRVSWGKTVSLGARVSVGVGVCDVEWRVMGRECVVGRMCVFGE